jgi:hypothetical protein
MFRNLFRRGVSVLVLTFVLAGAAPAAAADFSMLDRWEGLWGWVVGFWSADEGGEGDRGAGIAVLDSTRTARRPRRTGAQGSTRMANRSWESGAQVRCPRFFMA